MRFKKILAGFVLSTVLLGSLQFLYAQELFVEEFENEISGWQLVGRQSIQVVDSKDRNHRRVMQLEPDGEVYSLIRDSEKWGPVTVEGEVLFPNDGDNYLGLIYNYSDSGLRRNFGSIYIKGNESYVMVNPWRDSNASRLLYEEYKTALTGDDAIRINTWHKFKAEIMRNVCHFYVNDMTTPKVVFDLLEFSSGMIGFKPRIAGTPVWIDNIRVTSIKNLSYQGEKIPAIKYQPEMLVTEWQVIGPLSKPIESIERMKDPTKKEIRVDGSTYTWKPFNVDARGAVITGRITEYRGNRSVAYFRARIHADSNKTVTLHFTTTDELSLYVNGRFESFIYRDGYMSGNNDWNAWFDFWKNPQHAGRKIPIALNAGQNQIVVRVRNGQFASGGFFAHLESP